LAASVDANSQVIGAGDLTPERLIIESLKAVVPTAFDEIKRHSSGEHNLQELAHGYLEMYCRTQQEFDEEFTDLKAIWDVLHSSDLMRDRYLRTIALLVIGGVVPKKDKQSYAEIVHAQKVWERSDLRYAKSGENSFFNRMGGWNNLVALGTNAHYSLSKDPFLKENPAIDPKTLNASERLHADLFYFIDEICSNPGECQLEKITAFARNVSSLCGTDREQWRKWLGPPVIWLA
jgi:hypothetical protein